MVHNAPTVTAQPVPSDPVVHNVLAATAAISTLAFTNPSDKWYDAARSFVKTVEPHLDHEKNHGHF